MWREYGGRYEQHDYDTEEPLSFFNQLAEKLTVSFMALKQARFLLPEDPRESLARILIRDASLLQASRGWHPHLVRLVEVFVLLRG